MLEALVAGLTLSLGMLALSHLQSTLRAGADAARERSEAVRLAQLDIEGLRGFASLAGWNAIADQTADVTPPGSTTRYTLDRVVQTSDHVPLKAVQVTLRWTDRQGTARQLRLDTLIAGHDPALSGALGVPRPALAAP
jgi:Tfp pilus assembly protein PilV